MEALVSTSLAPEYVAGLLDGEGCFRINRSTRLHGLHYYCALSIRMRDDSVSLLRMLANQFAGSLYTESKSKAGGQNRNPSVLIEWRGPSAADICRQMLPHLVLKKKQAGLLLEFEILRISSHECEINRGKGNGSGGRKLPEVYYEQAKLLYIQCRELKRYPGDTT